VLAQKVLDMRVGILGRADALWANNAFVLACRYRDLGQTDKAEPLFRQVLEVRRRLLGENHPDYAQALWGLGALYCELKDYARAEPLVRKSADVYKRALGTNNPKYATALALVASVCNGQGDNAQAEPLYRQALAIFHGTGTDKTLAAANAVDNLANVDVALGRFAKAEPLYRQVLATFEALRAQNDVAYATAQCNLAALYALRNDYPRAEQLYRQALETVKRWPGDKHPDYARALTALADMYKSMKDYAAAEPLYRQALEINPHALDDNHPDYVMSLNALGGLYILTRDYARAESLLRAALEVAKGFSGRDRLVTARTLDDLGELYWRQGDYTRAEPCYRQAFEVDKTYWGEESLPYAGSLDSLGELYREMGDFARAEAMLVRRCEIVKKLLGEDSYEYALARSTLGKVYWSQGDYARAAPLLRQALEGSRQLLDNVAAMQSEQQQLRVAQNMRYRLDRYLSAAPRAGVSGEAVYGYVLAWKGAVFAQQRRVHELRHLGKGDDPAVTRLADRLDDTARELAALALAGPDPDKLAACKQRVAKLTERQERLEAELGRRSAAFRRQQELRAQTPAGVQAVLPADAALVDLLEYTRYDPPPQGKGKMLEERHLAAFVVRPDRAVVQLDLGPLAPITQAVDGWRQAVARKRTRGGERAAGAVLGRCLCQPLEPHLQGVRTLLVSPDGAVGRVPFAALPGSKPDTYLIEERAVAMVSVPQLLPELLARGEPAGDVAGKPSLLLVGDVDFAAAPGTADEDAGSRSPARGTTERLQFRPLPATLGEISVLEKYFRRRFRDAPVDVLEGAEATEEAVREQASRRRWLHLATHGFFAPPQLRSALAPDPGDASERQGAVGLHPGLLSGLALAGANRPPEDGQNDGILTALEVAELDLRNVDLAVLSACETGLGEVEGGEGLLGLQRAFQVAGARSVVASLWQVDDLWTRQLMERFYRNLWQKKMGKLDALREAQGWLLTEAPKPGLVLLEGDRKPVRTPPYFWAAFVLSGDWR
jgi:CHAT domain-containing protein